MNSMHLPILVLFLTMNVSFGQTNKDIDSLSKLTYDELNIGYDRFIDNDSVALIYGHAYLKKAKIENDTIRIANAFTQIANTLPTNEMLIYCDSIIELTKNSPSKEYPAWGHIAKGSVLFNLGDYKNSLHHYSEAYKSAIENNNDDFLFLLNNEIGQLKVFWGDAKDAVKIYKSQLSLLSSNEILNTTKNKLSVLFSLSNAYIIEKRLDSAKKYNNLGLKLTSNNLKKRYYLLFLEQSGEILLKMGNFVQAKDSLIKTISSDHTFFSLQNTYTLLGQIEQEFNNSTSAFNYFKKADLIVEETQDYTPETKIIYDFLQDYYIHKGDRKNQLVYTQKLRKTDSILAHNYKYVNRKLVENFEIPKILKENKASEKSLQEKDQIATSTYVVIFLISFSFAILFVTLVIKKRKNKANQLKGISPLVVKTILKDLEKYENKKDFTATNQTLSSVAKKIKTNSSYLSRIVNVKKGKSFSNYLTDLRIKYCIHQLTTSKTFHKYDIKSLANEFGFNNAESFSKAFEKETGSKPSNYIQNITS